MFYKISKGTFLYSRLYKINKDMIFASSIKGILFVSYRRLNICLRTILC